MTEDLIVPALLFIVLIIIVMIPSGPQCPECESYATQHIKGKAIHEKSKEQVLLEVKACYKCGNKWEILVNGLPKDEFERNQSLRDQDEENE